MIYFDNVSKIYNGNETALQDVTLSIESGEFISIVGHSGAGKTTLVKMLLAEDSPTSGAVFFESANIHNLSREELNQLRRRIGMVFQDFRLISNKTAYENIAFAMEAAGRSEEEIATDVPYVLDLVDLGDKIWNFPRELSGGEQQRTAILRALANDPKVILGDEPTGNLDSETGGKILEMLIDLNKIHEKTLIIVTHDAGIAEKADQIITLKDGHLVRDHQIHRKAYTEQWK